MRHSGQGLDGQSEGPRRRRPPAYQRAPARPLPRPRAPWVPPRRARRYRSRRSARNRELSGDRAQRVNFTAAERRWMTSSFRARRRLCRAAVSGAAAARAAAPLARSLSFAGVVGVGCVELGEAAVELVERVGEPLAGLVGGLVGVDGGGLDDTPAGVDDEAQAGALPGEPVLVADGAGERFRPGLAAVVAPAGVGGKRGVTSSIARRRSPCQTARQHSTSNGAASASS